MDNKFLIEVETYIIPRLDIMLEKEHAHRSMLLRSQQKSDTPIIRDFLKNSNESITQIMYSLEEYKRYLKDNKINT